MRVPELALHASRSIIRLLIRCRGESRLDNLVELLLERFGRLRQDVRHAARGDLDLEVQQQLTNLRLAHVAAILQRQDQGPQVRAEVSLVATCRERATEKVLLLCRVVDMSCETRVPWLDLDVLDNHGFILDTHRIGRQSERIDGTLDFLVNRHVFERTPVASRATLLVALASLLLRGMIRARGGSLLVRLLRVRGGFVLLLLFELFPQSMDFLGEFLFIGTERLDDIQKFLHSLARLNRQRPRSGQQRLHLLQNRLNIYTAHNSIIRKPTT